MKTVLIKVHSALLRSSFLRQNRQSFINVKFCQGTTRVHTSEKVREHTKESESKRVYGPHTR